MDETKRMRPCADDEWQYHQDGRDRVANVGCGTIICIVLMVALFVAIATFQAYAKENEAGTPAKENPMDGTSAGANAVTLDSLMGQAFKDEWEAGAYSVTLNDLERKVEPGQAYPANGKNTPLHSDSTYGKGAGMVDVITYDRSTNAMIRHFGQVQEDGSIRWYAAQYVLDEDGKPIIVPHE